MSRTPPRFKFPDNLPDLTTDIFRGQDVNEPLKLVRTILGDVRSDGWDAVKRYAKEYDDCVPGNSPLDRTVLEEARSNLSEELLATFEETKRRVRRYQKAIEPRSRVISDGQDGLLGEVIRPLETVGCYVPGGRFPLPSTVFMTAFIAEIAGVDRIVVCSPPVEETGQPHRTILGALSCLESVRVHGIGGAQAVGAMAHGSGPVPRVDLITGPGNLYVTLAKKEVYGTVDVDLLAGPSEIVVVATSEATNPKWVAADLLSQAEHDPRSRCFCVCPDQNFLNQVEQHIEDFLLEHPNSATVEAALGQSGLILTETVDEAIQVSNRLAPEHLELHIENPTRKAMDCSNAGAIFCGSYTPEAIGDYVAGPSHTLPTGGSARFFSPLSVRTFLRSQSVISLDPQQYEKLKQPARGFADVESLWAHAKSLEIRSRTNKTDCG